MFGVSALWVGSWFHERLLGDGFRHNADGSLKAAINGVPLCSLLACTLLVVGAGCSDDKKPEMANVMPDATPVGTVILADRGVGLLTESKQGEPCYQLRAGAVMGSHDELSQYGCIHSSDTLSTDFLVVQEHEAPTAASGPMTPVLIVRDRLAVGGAVAASVATVTVNGQPAYRDGPYFLAVLPTMPDSDINVVAADADGKVLGSQQYPRALITGQKTPAGAK